MGKFSDKFVDQTKTHILCSTTFSQKSYRLWDNVEKYCTAGQATDDSITRRMRIARCVTKAYDTNSEYVIHIAYALQQSFRDRASMLRYTQSACLVLEFRQT
jgi:hypothetical protein